MNNRYLALILSIVFSPCLTAQNFTGGFNFYLPPDDTSKSQYLPSFPARALTDQDFVSINAEGHFSVGGNTTRFFGTNLPMDGAYPTKTKAWYIAGRLRKMGFNIVRPTLLDLDPVWAVSIFEKGTDTRHLNPVTLDKLENLIAEFKKNGIYVQMDLHCGRMYTVYDGVANYDSFPNLSVAVNYFDPRILFLHKEYARQLLTHINPYTQRPLCNDPVMAWVVMTNENSLTEFWRLDYLKTWAEGGQLSYRHVRILDSLWIDYLNQKYASTSSLRSAWNTGIDTSQLTEKVRNGGFEKPASPDWNLFNGGIGSATMANDSINAYQGKYSEKITVSKTDGTNWHLQLLQGALSMTKDSSYQMSFAARSDSIRTILFTLSKSTEPYTTYAYLKPTLTKQWKTYSISYKPSETVVNDLQFALLVGSSKGTYWFDNASFGDIKIKGLLAGESFESNSIRRIDYQACKGYTDQRVKDMTDFYLSLEDNYFSSMKSFLKDTLGVKVPIVGTNLNYSAIDRAGLSSADFMDQHSYWDHPTFPSTPWSETDWHINNVAMVHSDGGTITGLMSGTAMINKPYLISEYGHIFPNRYQTEGPLFITSYASFQDVDGFMLFDYNSKSSGDWETDKIQGYFDQNRNTAMMCLMPSCAMAYRKGLIQKYQQLVTVQYQPDTYLRIPKIDFTYPWESISLYPTKISLEHGFRTTSYFADSTTDFSLLPANLTSPYTSDTKELVWDTSGLFTVSAPSFNAATGFFNSFPNHTFGSMTLVSGNNFGTVTWTALDTGSLLNTRKSLLTLSTRIENTDMIWEGTTTVHNNWGQAPTLIQPLTIKLKLNINADSLIVHPLDVYGNPGSSFKKYYASAPDMFTITFDQNADQTVWFGMDAFGKGGSFVNGTHSSVAREYALLQNYPNPFSSSTYISFDLPVNSFVSLQILDFFGREVETIVSGELSSGRHTLKWDATNRQEGVYFYRIQAGPYIETRKIILLK